MLEPKLQGVIAVNPLPLSLPKCPNQSTGLMLRFNYTIVSR